VGCLWLSRFLQLHLRKPSQWQALEHRLLQGSLLDQAATNDEAEQSDDDDATPAPPSATPAPGLAPPVPVQPIIPPRVPALHTSAPQAPAPRAPISMPGTISLGGMSRFRARP
jgi:hypothetical protein